MIAENLKLEKSFFGEKTIIIAKSGYGKSYTARVIIEDGIEIGNTFIIIDPQGAYKNLKEFEYIHFSDIKKIGEFANLLSSTNKNIVISTQKSLIEEQNKFLKIFLQKLRNTKQKGIQTLVIDEIHKYAPEGQKTFSKSEVIGMFQEDRSAGQGIIGITQRPARMDKTILSQADNLALGRVTSKADKQAIGNYLASNDEVEKLKNLDKGEFYLMGFDLDDIEIKKIRKSKTEHSGNSPKHLLNENSSVYYTHAHRVVRKNKKMTDKINSNDTIKGVIPSKEGMKDLISLGGKIALGGAVGGMGANMISKFVPTNWNIPYISNRTIGSTITTFGLYALYRAIPSNMNNIKEINKFAVAGSSVYLAGSLLGDVLNTTNLKLPLFIDNALNIATGVSFTSSDKSKDNVNKQSVDLNSGLA